MNVAVTGGGGFIGHYLLKQLQEAGHVTASLDLPDTDVAARVELSADCDAVIHLAGLLGTHELFDEPHRAVDVNVNGTLNVLQAAVAAEASYVGITMPRVFPSIYTATKTAAAELERAFHHTYGLPVSRVRAFNAFGAGQKHGPGHPQKLIPTFASLAWAGLPLPIWGDGEQTVDLIWANDLARLLVAALEHGDDLTIDGGCGLALTVNEIAVMVLDITGSSSKIEHLPMRRGELPTKIVATGEGWDRLDFPPQLDLEAFEETVNSYRLPAWAKLEAEGNRMSNPR